MLDGFDPPELPCLELTPELRKEVHRILGDPDFHHISIAFLTSRRVAERFKSERPNTADLIKGLTEASRDVEEALQPKKPEVNHPEGDPESGVPRRRVRRKTSRPIHTTELQKKVDVESGQKRATLFKNGKEASEFRGMMANFEEKIGQLRQGETCSNEIEAQKIAYLILNLLMAIRKGLAVQYQPFAIRNLGGDHPIINKILMEIERTRRYFNWLLPIFETKGES